MDIVPAIYAVFDTTTVRRQSNSGSAQALSEITRYFMDSRGRSQPSSQVPYRGALRPAFLYFSSRAVRSATISGCSS